MKDSDLQFLSAEVDGNDLYVLLNKRIDGNNYNEVENEIKLLSSEFPDKKMIFVGSRLDYISSAGLRIFIRLAKTGRDLEVIELSPNMYDLFKMIGVTSVIPTSLAEVRERPEEQVELKESEEINGKKVVYRALEEDDIDKLIDIGRSTIDEHRRRTTSESEGAMLISVDFANSLNKANFARVAVVDEEPVAVIMGRSDINQNSEETEPFPKLKNTMNKFNLMLNKDGRKMYNGLKAFEKYDEQLVEDANRTFDGELVYFNQLPELYETPALGYSLLEQFRQHMANQGARNFYLLIHSDSKKEFFEDKNFNLVDTLELDDNKLQDNVILLYEYDVENPAL